MKTQDTIARRSYTVTYQKAVDELIKMYGERYIDYRNKFELAGKFEFEPSFPLYLMLEQSQTICHLIMIT